MRGAAILINAQPPMMRAAYLNMVSLVRTHGIADQLAAHEQGADLHNQIDDVHTLLLKELVGK